jgi:Acetyltransferase (GNAT) family
MGNSGVLQVRDPHYPGLVASPVSLCAEAVAGWHSSWCRALGIPTERDQWAWRALAPPHFIYFAAITLREDTPAEAVVEAPGSVCDNWQAIDLSPHGFSVFREEPWFHRVPGPVPDEAPPELELVRATTPAEVQELELVSVRGFENERATIEPGTMHPASVLDDPAMALFIGRVGGEPIGAAMGYRTDQAVGVFGVTTVASARGRGYGTALTRAAMLPESGLPAVLAPSKEAERMYRRLGFRPVGALSIWTKKRLGP